MGRQYILYDFNPIKCIETYVQPKRQFILENVSYVLSINVHSAVTVWITHMYIHIETINIEFLFFPSTLNF